jgi:hypothetical protein
MVDICNSNQKKYDICASTNSCAVGIGADKTMFACGALAKEMGTTKREDVRRKLSGVVAVFIDQTEAESAHNLARMLGIANDKKVHVVVPSGDIYQPGQWG